MSTTTTRTPKATKDVKAQTVEEECAERAERTVAEVLRDASDEITCSLRLSPTDFQSSFIHGAGVAAGALAALATISLSIGIVRQIVGSPA